MNQDINIDIRADFKMFLRNGIRLVENYAIQSGRMVHEQLSNTIHVPEDGTIYTIIFINGVDEDSIDTACEYALAKINQHIKKLTFDYQ